MTICERCNNELLGRQYDPALHRMSRKVGQVLRVAKRCALPPRVPVSIKPQRVARAVVGHLLAAEEIAPGVARRAPLLEEMRDFFLDETAELPKSLRLYWWPYRGHQRVTILRGVSVLFGFTQVSPPPTVIGDFLKFFPLSFWLTSKMPQSIASQIADLEIDPRGLSMDDEEELSVATMASDTFASDWPEHPTGYQVLLMNGDACVVAEPA